MIISNERMEITYINSHLRTMFKLELENDFKEYLFRKIKFKVLKKRTEFSLKSFVNIN